MRVINAPYYGHIYPNEMAVFLAGGIKGCRNWQEEIINHLFQLDATQKRIFLTEDLVILNPRAGIFDSNDEDCVTRQVEWEYYYLKKANIVSFWFSKETLNPITLFEFGGQMANVSALPSHKLLQNPSQGKRIIVGSDPEYQKLQDIKIQSKLAGWDGTIRYNTKDIIDDIVQYYRRFKYLPL